MCYNKEVIHKNKRNHPQLAGCHNPRRNQFIQRNPLLIHIPSLTPSSHARFLQLSNRLQYGLQRLTTSASPANIKIYSNLQTEAFEKIFTQTLCFKTSRNDFQVFITMYYTTRKIFICRKVDSSWTWIRCVKWNLPSYTSRPNYIFLCTYVYVLRTRRRQDKPNIKKTSAQFNELNIVILNRCTLLTSIPCILYGGRSATLRNASSPAIYWNLSF